MRHLQPNLKRSHVGITTRAAPGIQLCQRVWSGVRNPGAVCRWKIEDGEVAMLMAHRFLALIIAVAVFVFYLRIWRDARGIAALMRLSILWVALLFLQLALGAWTIWSNKAADIATAHVAVGAIMLSFGVSICAICWRILHGRAVERSTTKFEARGAEVI